MSLAAQTLVYVLIYESKSVYLTIACYVMIGLCAGGRVAIGTTYLSEFIPARFTNIVTGFINIGDSTVMIFQAIYYSFNKNWQPLHQFGIGIFILIVLCALVIPESPKFYYAHHKYDQARQKLKVVAYYNGASITKDEIDKIVFDTEKASHGSQVEY